MRIVGVEEEEEEEVLSSSRGFLFIYSMAIDRIEKKDNANQHIYVCSIEPM